VNDPRAFRDFLKYPPVDAIFDPRTRRVSRGAKRAPAGSLSVESPAAEPRPLSDL
jgi:hypothetical protein